MGLDMMDYKFNLPDNLPGHPDYRNRVPIIEGTVRASNLNAALARFLHREDKKKGLKNNGHVYHWLLFENIEDYATEITTAKKPAKITKRAVDNDIISLDTMKYELSNLFAGRRYEKEGSKNPYETLRHEEEEKLDKLGYGKVSKLFYDLCDRRRLK